jgi:hypothetical protein
VTEQSDAHPDITPPHGDPMRPYTAPDQDAPQENPERSPADIPAPEPEDGPDGGGDADPGAGAD